MRSEPFRILHCPMNVGNNPYSLAQAERALGWDSHALVYERHYMRFPIDEVILTPGDNRLMRELKRWRLLWRALRRFDLIHFNFGQAILPMQGGDRRGKYPGPAYRVYDWYVRLVYARDLQLLRRAGKGIVVTYQGDDARQGDFCRAHFDISIAHAVGPDYYSPEGDARKRRNIATFGRYADRIYALNPDLLYVLPPHARFMPYAILDPDAWTPRYPRPDAPRLHVVHAPTHKVAKGTRHILEAVARLRQQDHLDFEFTLVENTSNAEARRVYERADLLVDQLLAGWYGGLSVELMALGKPAICYLRAEDLKFIPDAMRAAMPVISATPQSIYAVLKEYLTDRRHALPTVGRRARAYVERWHHPRKIAEMLIQDYADILAARGRVG